MKSAFLALLGCVLFFQVQSDETFCGPILNDETYGEFIACIPEDGWVTRLFEKCTNGDAEYLRDACKSKDVDALMSFGTCIQGGMDGMDDPETVKAKHGEKGEEEANAFRACLRVGGMIPTK